MRVSPVIGLSIVGRAVERGLVAVRVHDLLDGLEPGARADERPYGGGPGMVLRIEPLARTLDGILAEAPAGERRRIVLTAAAGRPFTHPDAMAFARLDRMILICGHYEGVDERLSALYPIEEVSLGPFVLTGGEIAAMAFLDATARLIDGVIAAESRDAESFAAGADALDHPAFTRPPVFRGVAVPGVLLSGDHAKIAEWRRQRSRERAAARRPGYGALGLGCAKHAPRKGWQPWRGDCRWPRPAGRARSPQRYPETALMRHTRKRPALERVPVSWYTRRVVAAPVRPQSRAPY